MGEDGRAVALHVLIEADAGAGLGHGGASVWPCGPQADHAAGDDAETNKLPSGSQWLHEIKRDGFKGTVRRNRPHRHKLGTLRERTRLRG
jgi:hypothetical protein